MRYAIPLLACCLIALPGCKKEPANKKPATGGAAPAGATPKPVEQSASAAPNNDAKGIQGTWETSEGDPVQAEFAGDTIILRAGPGPAWKETARGMFKLSAPSTGVVRQIDWGTGATAAYGRYTLDEPNLIINYGTGSPDARPKDLAKKPTAKQLFMKRVK